MTRKRLHCWILWGLILPVGLSAVRQAVCGEGASSPAGHALDSIFNPSRAPAQRTMGLLQRSFLDLVETSQPELQIAIVVDGTDSMDADLAGVRATLKSMVEDLRKYKGDHVSCALVVYRDTGARSGEITTPLRQFTKDTGTLEKAFAAIQPESGAPYFPELVDLGVHEALNALEWSDSPEASRWLLLVGDAPPYDPDFQEAETGARRRYDTDVLVNLARRKNIQVNCILCTSRDSEKPAYQQVLDKTRRFMNALATETGGLMLDLSYPDIRQSLANAANKGRVEQQHIGRITRDDINTAKALAESAKVNVAASQRIRLAVLPHVPLEQMTFDPDNEAVQIAAELREKLRQVPRAEVRSPVDVDRALRRVKSANLPPEQWLQALAVQLRAEYVVWGTYRRAQGIVRVKSAIYGKDDGRQKAEADSFTSDSLPENELVGNLTTKLMLAASNVQAPPDLVAVFAAARQDARPNAPLLTPVANNAETRNDLLAGFESLEQALAHPAGSAEAMSLLVQSDQKLKQAAHQDPRNPFVHLLHASCHFNLAQAMVREDRRDEANAHVREFSEALKRAYRERDNTRDNDLRTEIQADYHLLVKKDYAEAVRLYQSLANAKADTQLHTALRAHWMLAGIFSGDWGVDAALIDRSAARDHLIQILAHWEDSSEAAFIKRQLRWDEEKGQNQFEHFPRDNNMTLAGIF